MVVSPLYMLCQKRECIGIQQFQLFYSLISCTTPWIYCGPYSSMNQQLSEKSFTMKVATMDDFHYKRKLSHATTKATLSADSKDEWGTKKNANKSMKNALCVRTLNCHKAPFRLKQHWTAKKIEAHSLVGYTWLQSSVKQQKKMLILLWRSLNHCADD